MTDGTIGQAVRTETAQPVPASTPNVQQRPAAAPPKQETAPKPATRPEQRESARVREQISTEELAEMLHKINLTFDLFEIEAEFSFDQEDNQVRVVVRNTRTNEVIRRIPAHEFKAQFTNFRDGVGLLIDSFL